MNDAKQSVAPIAGYYALLRNGMVCGPLRNQYEGQSWFVDDIADDINWRPNGSIFLGEDQEPHNYDIVAVASPEAVRSAFSFQGAANEKG
jgi:hypothetical protein